MKRLAVLFVAALVTACSSPYQQSSGIPSAPQNSALRNGSSNPIKYVVVVMQENRSFDNLFFGFPKADTATFGYGHGVKYTLVSKPLKWSFDPNHYHYQFLEDYDGGKNDGWDQLIRGEVQSSQCTKYSYQWVNHPACWWLWTGKTYQQMAFSYVQKSDVQPYWTMASQYTIGDHNFASTN